MGIGEHANVAHIIDFGLSKEFRDPRTRLHIPRGDALGLTGTATFASIHSHLGLELGRRDDLESLAYILIYFLHGSLPRQGLDFEGCDLVAESKQQTPTHDLCYGLPPELHTFLDYSRSLSFNDKPNYNYLCSLFDNSLSRAGLKSDTAFDWDESDGRVDEPLSARRELRFDRLKHINSPKWRAGCLPKFKTCSHVNKFIQIAFSGCSTSTAYCCEMKPLFSLHHDHCNCFL
jgi:serine/threonine protein kinase